MSSRRFMLRYRYVLLLVHYFADIICSEPEVQLEFPGHHILQSGTGNFKAWIVPHVQVKCTVKHFEGRDLKYTLNIQTEGQNIQRVSRTEYSIVQQVTRVSDHMVFSCHLSVICPNVNVSFEKQATVTLSFVSGHNFPQCISSIGTVGLPNESIQLACVNCDSSDQIIWKNRDIDMDMPVPFGNDCQVVRGRTKLLEDMKGVEIYPCGYENSEKNVCSLQIDIKRDLLLEINPPIFNPNEEHFTFTCFSNPPSKVHWYIHTELGDVLRIISQRGVNFPNLEKQTQTKINISYAHGNSTLNLTTTARVYLVSCWTFRKMFRQAVSRALPYETVKNCTSNTTDQSALPEDTVQCSSKCVSDITSTSQSFQKCTNERIVYFIIIGGLFVLVILLAAYLITRFLMKSSCCLASNNTEQNDNLPPMVTNTAYVEYNDVNKNQSNSTYQTYNNEGSTPLPYAELNIISRGQEDETD